MDVLSGIGSLAGAGASIYGSKSSARSLARAIKKQIAWERERAHNAHQWEVQDLKAAGLNPILSAGGEGAMTGGISAPVPDTSGYTAAGEQIGSLIKQIADTNLTNTTAKNVTADTQVKNEQSQLLAQQTLNEGVKNGLISAQKASTEFDNLKKQYDWEKRDLTYWNDFINKASSSARNVSEAISLPKLLKIFKSDRLKTMTPDKLEKMLSGAQPLE